ncbi:thioesterase family protein [Pseudooceanicola pacificus]
MSVFISSLMSLKPEWIDFNGHLNMAYYNVLFDLGCDEAWEQFGFGPAYRERTGHTTFAAEHRTRYVRELAPESRVRVSFHMLDVGPKAFHYCQELRHEDGWLPATGEGVSLHVDQSGPRVAPYPPEILERLNAMLKQHAGEPVPEWVGSRMGIRK